MIAKKKRRVRNSKINIDFTSILIFFHVILKPIGIYKTYAKQCKKSVSKNIANEEFQ